MTIHITGTGTATQIGNKSVTASASLDLTANVDKASAGHARLNVTSGTLTIGSQTYTVVNGHGIIHFHSDQVVIHVHLKDSHGNSVRLILHGKANLPKTLAVNSTFNVDFKKPESKLAGKWFLQFQGATATKIA